MVPPRPLQAFKPSRFGLAESRPARGAGEKNVARKLPLPPDSQEKKVCVPAERQEVAGRRDTSFAAREAQHTLDMHADRSAPVFKAKIESYTGRCGDGAPAADAFPFFCVHA